MPPQFVLGSPLLEAAWAAGIFVVFVLGAWLILWGMRRIQRRLEKRGRATLASQLLQSLAKPLFLLVVFLNLKKTSSVQEYLN